MNIHRKLLLGLFALAAFSPLGFVPGSAYAQRSASAEPRIDGFDVKPVTQIAPGREMIFTLYGTPGGTARVQISGAASPVQLDEVEAGVYEGAYVIRQRDGVTAQSTATANLRVGNKVASGVLDETLVASARRSGGAASANAPKIDRFDVDPPNRLDPGADLIFTLTGTPGGTASVRIVGVRGKLALDEIRPGVYENAYIVKNRDRIEPNAVVTGNLRVGSHESNTVLHKSLVSGGAPQRTAATVSQSTPPPPPRRAICGNCGVVERVDVVEVKGDGKYLGLIAGGVAGALLGSQVGSGRGTTVAQVAGAAGGALAGREIERRMKTEKHYEVVVRLENGGSQIVPYAADPGVAVGTRVRIENNTLVRL